MTDTTHSPTAIADLYIATWNEADPQRRRALIAQGWSEDASYLDPLAAVHGHDGLDALIDAVQRQFPGLCFSLRGAVDGYGDRLRFSWALGAEGGELVAHGTDFALMASDGRLRSVTGFLDRMPTV
ncbi:nuclear transport factor 2 family protein [Azospirillum sp. YIM B02556]|uniref:Nuclear transport factor 2 family protein n=1 Tax=Azospirillum endophyticum TaxID=2800326 RepID=A0ABS1FBU5_9PROT|nr:nuclear transport factor 2 family protein [Azospirillum endophyticum]MBK1840905.1 nuclear transport factor 2 family protein [Azospirillum endophyticum]